MMPQGGHGEGASAASLPPNPARTSPKVSVIVPVHGIPRDFLAECMDSLQRQTLEDLEILPVLDGPDAELQRLLEERAECDSRMVVLRLPENKGVSAARNLGLEKASGEWFAFVDADDWVESTMFATLLRAAEESRALLSACTWVRGSSPETPAPLAEDTSVLDFSNPGNLARAMGLLRNGSCCARLFSRRAFGTLRFDEDLRHGEDLVFLQKALDGTGRLAWVPQALYVYRPRSGSASLAPLSLDSYKNWLTGLERRMVVSRRLLRDVPRAQSVLAWDTLCAVNDPRVRSGWPRESRRDGWLATRRFIQALDADLAVLPLDIRAVWRWEMLSLRNFYHRPRWVNGWMWHRARRALAALAS